MLFKSVVLGLLAAQVFAQPLEGEHQHKHQHEKKDVKVVTKVNVVTVTAGYGAEELTSSVVLSTPTNAVSINTDTSSYAAQAKPSSFSNPSTFETKVSTTYTPSSTAGSDSTETSDSAPSGGAGAAGAKGITYTPYSDNGGCKTYSEIASELKQISDYDIIRLYGVDCDQVNAVLANKASHQKVFAGIFDVSDISGGIKTLASAVENNGGWDHIDTVSVGNELVNNGQANPSQISSYVKEAKSALESAGYSGPVVSVDTFIAVINNPELCKYSDYMAVNAHAFFDGHYTADQAGKWVLQQIQRVYTACGGDKRVFITETGWPSKGDSNGEAVPSPENQSAAIKSIKDTCGDASTLFTAFNDMWKSPGAFNAEQYWGILN